MVWLALLAACGGVDCAATPTAALAQAGDATLTCAEAGEAQRAVEQLAARRLTAAQSRDLRAALTAAWSREPAAWEQRLAQARAAREALAEEQGLEAAASRSHALWEALHGEGPLGADPDVRVVVRLAAAPWAQDDAQQLVLSEMDIEGWIFYASLCREVQGGGTLRLSVADRVMVYRRLQEAWDAAPPEDRLLLVGMGAFWEDVKSRWAAAPWEVQQRWIAAAPLPPPMNATSLGYAEALLGGDLPLHARTLHSGLGPLSLWEP
ncbi:MAG: hypothetical protein JXX28_06815 [Deltaproteobacteria bacterium]|nr:hypothetical protein [Deltaproteobacteria bacterium]